MVVIEERAALKAMLDGDYPKAENLLSAVIAEKEGQIAVHLVERAKARLKMGDIIGARSDANKARILNEKLWQPEVILQQCDAANAANFEAEENQPLAAVNLEAKENQPLAAVNLEAKENQPLATVNLEAEENQKLAAAEDQSGTDAVAAGLLSLAGSLPPLPEWELLFDRKLTRNEATKRVTFPKPVGKRLYTEAGSKVQAGNVDSLILDIQKQDEQDNVVSISLYQNVGKGSYVLNWIPFLRKNRDWVNENDHVSFHSRWVEVNGGQAKLKLKVMRP